MPTPKVWPACVSEMLEATYMTTHGVNAEGHNINIQLPQHQYSMSQKPEILYSVNSVL
jgi:hypothetical protein